MGICSSNITSANHENGVKYTYNPDVIQNYNLQNTIKFYPHIEKGYVIDVYDGDTFTIATPVLNTKNNYVYRFSVRVQGVDCPELRTKDKDEKYVALKAKEFAESVLLHKHIILKNIQYDKYGRILACVFVDNKNYSELLIHSKLAVEYNGNTKCSPKNWRSFYEQ
jgi:micrococcal nuclease